MIDSLYTKFKECDQKICTDTRKIIPGSIFFALKGSNFNGNTFALMALKQGAAYAVVDENVIDNEEAFQKFKDRLINVTDVLSTFQHLANFHRRKYNFPVLAITGSNGKTTSKELVSRVISKKFNTLFTQGNLNNHIGVPLTLLQINQKTEFAVIEMGANHQGEIKDLCAIAEPTHGFITNVGKSHLEGFGGFEGVIKGKTELYDYLKKTEGTIFCNYENHWLKPLCNNYDKVFYYGNNNSAKVAGELITDSDLLKINWMENTIPVGIPHIIQTQMTGAYNFENILSAIALGCYFGVEPHEIKEAIESYVPSNQRSQIIMKGSNKIVADYYNANPTSMEQAILNFSKMEGKHKIVCLGDMFELGVDEGKEHLFVINLIKEKKFEKVILVGSRFATHKNQIEANFFDNSELARDFLKTLNISNSLMLIKGSRSSRMEVLLDGLN